jgi:hypothetical protein
MLFQESGEFLPFTHVRTASYFAVMLPALGINPSTDHEEAIFPPCRGIGGNAIKELIQAFVLPYASDIPLSSNVAIAYLQNGVDEHFIGVGEAEERSGRVLARFQSFHGSDHRRVLQSCWRYFSPLGRMIITNDR